MSATPPGDQARVSVSIALPPPAVFKLFTEEIDRWWRRGPRFRNAGTHSGLVHLEPRIGGRLFESFDTEAGAQVFEVGQVTHWEPPARLAFTWRNSVFEAHELTLVEVEFRATASGSLVTVTHRGWAAIRADHPARHGMDTATFCRHLGLWWGDQVTSLRERATGADTGGGAISG